MIEKKKGPAPNRTPFISPLYFPGGRHIGYKCSECGGTWLKKAPQWHFEKCVVRKDSLGLDG